MHTKTAAPTPSKSEPTVLTPEALASIVAALRRSLITVENRMLYDRQRAAHQLCVSTRDIDYLIACGKLKTKRLGRKVMIPHAELTRFASRDHAEDLAC